MYQTKTSTDLFNGVRHVLVGTFFSILDLWLMNSRYLELCRQEFRLH
jgi:hypothetical protein